MNYDKFRNDVLKNIDFLLNKYKFSIIFENEDNENYGNYIMILESELCCLRIIKDRRNVFVDIGTKISLRNYYGGRKDEWYYIEQVIDFIKNRNGEENKSIDDSFNNNSIINKYTTRLKAYGYKMFELFEINNFKKIKLELNDFCNKRKEEKFSKIFTDKKIGK